MRKQYLHLSAYSCDQCEGPVISSSIGVRENEISKETNIREVGAICLSCGHRQSKANGPGAGGDTGLATRSMERTERYRNGAYDDRI